MKLMYAKMRQHCKQIVDDVYNSHRSLIIQCIDNRRCYVPSFMFKVPSNSVLSTTLGAVRYLLQRYKRHVASDLNPLFVRPHQYNLIQSLKKICLCSRLSSPSKNTIPTTTNKKPGIPPAMAITYPGWPLSPLDLSSEILVGGPGVGVKNKNLITELSPSVDWARFPGGLVVITETTQKHVRTNRKPES